MTARVLRLSLEDDVAIALTELGDVVARGSVPRGHKIALRDLSELGLGREEIVPWQLGAVL